jgi:RHS repeat-associated protein
MARTAPVPNLPPIPGMCPSIAVLAGGGDGGGGGGNGADNGNGNGPGDGSGEGEAAAGDGSGTGNCGEGGQGSCTNCADGTAAGDPVDIGSGNTFTMPNLDVVLPGPVALHWSRSYSAKHRRKDVGLGYGWSFTFGWSLEVRRASVRLSTGSGSQVDFPGELRPGEESPRIGGFILQREAAGSYRVVGESHFIHTFEARPGNQDQHRLLSVAHESGNGFRLEYKSDGSLARVLDAAGRWIDVGSDSRGHITTLSVADPTTGRRIVFASFVYDDYKLVAHTDADGATTRYGYDETHRLTLLEYANGLRFHYRYDGQDRCVETWGEAEGLDEVLDSDLPTTLVDGETKARGIFHNVLVFGEGGYSEAFDSVRSVRVFSDEKGRITKGVGARGGVSNRERDEFGRLVRHIDPAGATTLFQWDDHNRLVGTIDPLGHRELYVRDANGYPIQTIDRAGGLIDATRDARGNATEIVDQAGRLTKYKFDDRNLLTEVVGPNGGTTRYRTDAHGNIIERTLPDGSRWQWTWDYFGRPVTRVDPRGGVTRTLYSDAGNVLKIVEPDGRTVDYSYDRMGSCTSISINGSTTRFDLGGLRWRIKETYPDGSSVRYRFNREGWCTRITNKVGEEARFEYNASGQATKVELFDGTVRHNRWDAMNHLSAYNDGAGWVTLERDVTGKVVSCTYPDGTTETVEYDAMEMPIAWKGPGGSLRVVRDSLGRITRESVTASGLTTEVLTSYGSDGAPRSLQTSLGYEERTERDVVGRRTSVRLNDKEVTFEYEPLGLETARVLPEGGRIETEWDVAPRVRSRTLRRRTGPARISQDEPQWVGKQGSSNEVVTRFTYDAADNIVGVWDPEEEVTLSYDRGQHLVSRESTKSSQEKFFVDAAGRYREADLPREVAQGGRVTRRGHVTYTWNDRGQLTRKSDVDGRPTDFLWDAQGRLAKVVAGPREVHFAYDPLGRRTTRTSYLRVGAKRRRDSHVRFVWNGDKLVHEYHEVGQSKANRKRVRITYAGDGRHSVFAERVDRLDGDAVALGEWAFHVQDAAGAPTRLASASGTTLARLDRSALGRMRSDGKFTTNVRLQGQLEDDETGLHYNRHRYYDPELGTFINRDPIGPRGGLELYSFAPNPIGFADPLGLQHECTCRLVTSGHPNGVGPTGSTVPRNGEATPGFTSGFGSVGAANFIPGMEGSTAPPRRTQNDTQANSHTEMHATEWAEHHLDANELEGSTMHLGGQHPPCAMCSRRMQRFAANHGATVEYNWPVNNRLQYDGREDDNGESDPRPRAIHHQGNAIGADARELEAANQTTAYSRRRARERGDDDGTDAHRTVYERQMAARAATPPAGNHVDDTWP